jgi:hypothetical protein
MIERRVKLLHVRTFFVQSDVIVELAPQNFQCFHDVPSYSGNNDG